MTRDTNRMSKQEIIDTLKGLVFDACLQEHCAAFVDKHSGEKWCNHYHSQVEYFESEGA